MSRSLLILSALLLCATYGQAAPENGAEVTQSVTAERPSFSSKIERVVVYPDCARVTRSADVTLAPGINVIVIKGVPQKMWDSSVSAETLIPGAAITSVSVKVRYTSLENKAEEQKAKDELTQQGSVIEILNRQIAVNEDYLTRLSDLRPVQPERAKDGKPLPFDLKAAESTLQFSSEEIIKTRAELRKLYRKLELAQLDMEVLQSNYNKLRSYRVTSEKVAEIKVLSPNGGAGKIQLNYMIGESGWNPTYDIRVDPENKSVKVVSYGVLRQNTGEDWNYVPVSLSTAQPLQSVDLPEFKKILITESYDAPSEDGMLNAPAVPMSQKLSGRGMGYASRSNRSNGDSIARKSRILSNSQVGQLRQDFYEAESQSVQMMDDVRQNKIILNSNKSIIASNIRRQSGNLIFEDEQGLTQKVAVNDIQNLSQAYTETQKNEISPSRLVNPARFLRGLDYRYDLARPENILSMGEAHKYLLSSETYQGEFFYQIEPTVNENAYQMIRLQNPKFRPLLPGPAFIFHGSDFVGDMDVPYLIQNAKMNIALGIDQRVKVKRDVSQKIETVGTFSSSQRKSVESNVFVKNNTPAPITVEIADVVPVSSQDIVKVSSPAFAPAISTYDKAQGRAVWSQSITPGKEDVFKINYRIDYPEKHRLIEGLSTAQSIQN